MSNFFHKIKNGLNLQPQTTAPTGLQDGDIYHDATLGLMVQTAGVTQAAGKTYSADNTTLALLGTTFSVANGGISNAQIASAASIALSKLAALTANRVVITDGSGFLTQSVATTTEASYLSGVTSAIQTQLNGKQISGSYLTALTGDVAASGPGSTVATIQLGVVDNSKISATAAIAFSKLATLTASRALVSDASGVISPSATTSTELGYVSGVTSALQGQLNGKQASSVELSAIAALVGTGYLQKTGVGTYVLATPASASPGVRMVTIGSSNSDYTTLNAAKTAMGTNPCLFKLSPETHTLTANVQLELGQIIEGAGGGSVIDVSTFKITRPTAAAGVGTQYDTSFAPTATGAGTISVTSGSTAATTSIDISASIGGQGWFFINGQRYRVQSVSGTSVTLAMAYRGNTDTAADLWYQTYYSEGNNDSWAGIRNCTIRTANTGTAPVEVIGMWFKMENVEIKHSSIGYQTGLVYIHDAADVEILNCKFYTYAKFSSDFTAIGGAAVRMENCRKIIIKDCRAENVARILVCNNGQSVVNKYCSLDFNICENVFNFTGSTQFGLLWESTLNIDQITGGRGGDYFVNLNGVTGVLRYNRISFGNLFLPGQLVALSGSAGGGNVGNIYSFGVVQAAVIRINSSADTAAGRRNTILSGDISGQADVDATILGIVSYGSLSGTPFRNAGGLR